MTYGIKNAKKLICDWFCPSCCHVRHMGYTSMTTFLRILCLFGSIFSVILSIDKLHFIQGIFYSNIGYHGNRKKAISQYHNNGCYGKKKLHQNLESYRFKRPLKKLFDWTNAW